MRQATGPQNTGRAEMEDGEVRTQTSKYENKTEKAGQKKMTNESQRDTRRTRIRNKQRRKGNLEGAEEGMRGLGAGRRRRKDG